MSNRRAKKATSVIEEDEDFTSEADELSETITKALDAARLADDAADDIEKLKSAHDAFVAKVQAQGKRMGALAIGAMVGGLMATTIAGLVYFRSVKDLRENAELQAETLAQLVEQTAALREVVSQAGNQQGALNTEITTAISQSTERLSTELATFATENAGIGNQMAAGMGTEMTAQLTMMQEAIVASIAELDVSLKSVITGQGGAGMSTADQEEITALIEELRTAVATVQLAAVRPAPAPAAPTPSRPATSGGTTGSGSSRATPPPANPFSFP